MEDERKDTANADMARSGHDRGISQDGEGIQRSDSEDGHYQNSTRASSQDTQLLANQTDSEYAELADSMPDAITSVSAQSMEWCAPLPPPSVFNQYDDKAQDAIIREFERESERNDKTLETYRELDKEESERRNKILNQENKKISSALWMTFFINIFLLIIALVAAILQQTNISVAALTVLGGVAVSKAFSQRNSIK